MCIAGLREASGGKLSLTEVLRDGGNCKIICLHRVAKACVSCNTPLKVLLGVRRGQ